MLDANCDGVVDKDELQAGFELVFGGDSSQMPDVDQIFARLDLDGTTRITYTEFCAASLGDRAHTQETMLWAAFKTFDIRDDGRITREEMQQVLTNADIHTMWSEELCEDVACQVVKEFGGEDGTIHFQEWLSLMHDSASRQHVEPPRRASRSDSQLDDMLQLAGVHSDRRLVAASERRASITPGSSTIAGSRQSTTCCTCGPGVPSCALL